jgi:type IV pilus assembly protein PilV
MRRQHRRLLKSRRGFGLVDGIIALAILAFGLLGLTRLQTRTLALGTESLARATAVQFGSELLSVALIDNTNYACYTLPAAGACGSATGRAYTTDWNTRLAAALPSGAATSTYDAATSRLKVVVTWTGKSAGDARRMEATTDVR